MALLNKKREREVCNILQMRCINNDYSHRNSNLLSILDDLLMNVNMDCVDIMVMINKYNVF